MLFLHFFVWGAWFATLGLVLHGKGRDELIASAYSAGPIASMLGTIIIGVVASRLLRPEILLVFIHSLGGVLLLVLPRLLDTGQGQGFIGALFAYLLLFMPAIGLANSVSLAVFEGRPHLFPFARSLGTIGWIVSGIIIGGSGLSASAEVFRIAGVASLLLALVCMGLPRTAEIEGPRKIREILGIDAFSLLKRADFRIFICCAILISMPLAAYYSYASTFLADLGIENVGGALAFGQVSELCFMLSLPFFFKKFGIKPLLLAAMIAWLVRYALFAAAGNGAGLWTVYVGILLHGLCFDFFFVAGAVYVDSVAAPAIRAQAQSLFSFATYGVGMFAGSQLAGLLFAGLAKPSTGMPLDAWSWFWLWPAGASLAVACIFFVGFNARFFSGQRKESRS